MEVSGTLRKKTIDFYKEQMISFDEEHLETPDLIINYKGEITPVAYYEDQIQKLSVRQEKIILKAIDIILNISKRFNKATYIGIRDLTDRVLETPRRYTFALLEELNRLICNESRVYVLEKQFDLYVLLLDGLKLFDKYLDSIQFEYFLKIYLRNKELTIDDINQKIFTDLHVYDEYLSQSFSKIYQMGKFVAPSRVADIASDITREQAMFEYIAPIYFALKDEQQAKSFLNKAQKCEAFTDLEKEAKLLRVPQNLIDMVRR